MSDMNLLPPGPWIVREGPPIRNHESQGPGYIEVRGPNNEAVCTIFAFAGNGGIGIERARAVARLIVEARDAAINE